MERVSLALADGQRVRDVDMALGFFDIENPLRILRLHVADMALAGQFLTPSADALPTQDELGVFRRAVPHPLPLPKNLMYLLTDFSSVFGTISLRRSVTLMPSFDEQEKIFFAARSATVTHGDGVS